jgi:hypothetical protein
LVQVRTTVQQTISDFVGRQDVVDLRTAGNFGSGVQFDGFGAWIRWTSRTQAALNDWNEEGRAVGCVNVLLKGGTGLGGLPLLKAVDLVASIRELGFDRIRRLDATVDVFDHPELTVQRIRDELSAGTWKIPRRNVKTFKYTGPIVDVEAGVQGATLYIGDRGSDVQVVVYDKGAQLEQEGSWLRVEVRFQGEPAYDALWALSQASDAASESGDAEALMDACVVGLVRRAFDVRDVSRYGPSGKLPKNWANSSSITYPALMHPVFAEIAPLDLGSFKATGVFASRTRHLMRSSSKHIWRLAIISMAKGDDPGSIGLTIGAPSAGLITDDDFSDMAQASGFSIADLELAEQACHTALLKLHGIDAECVATNRTVVRDQLMRSLGGV